TIPVANWHKFWAEPMFSSIRNAWFRAVHNKLPTAASLNQIILDFLPTSCCQLCHSMVDTLDHFLVTCPVRWSVWTRMWGPLFFCEPEAHALIQIITKLDWHLLPTLSTRKYSATIQCTLLAIWRAYWSYIFDNTPFLPDAVARSTLSLIPKLLGSASDG
ncbi:hypothetical protein BDB00DRAFT_762100, partial [Zychaea mexicana]|uniref:uncharacterized protein n=1 Tax=Zychaea mexicana TaxID=64656 RepID=UPI0022FE60C1